MRRVDEGHRCKAERSKRRNKIVSEDMLRDKRGVEALQGLNWGNFFLFISISTGGLNTRWLSRAWTSRWNHHWPHVQSAGYNFYTFRNKMKQVARVWKWQVVWLVCQAARWILWQGGLALGRAEHVGWRSRNYSETNDKNTVYKQGKRWGVWY